MGTIHRLPVAPDSPTLAHAVAEYLDHAHLAAQSRTGYARTLRHLTAHVGADTTVATLESDSAAADLAAWFGKQWGGTAAATYNRALDVLRSAVGYWRDQGWITADPTRRLSHRARPADRTRALDRDELEQVLTRADLDLRDKTLFRMLYETAARSREVLALDVEDLDLRNRRTKVRRKGGAADVIVWRTATARLLPRMLAGRTRGPLFVTERRARVELPTADLDEHGRARLSYRQALDRFTAASGGATLHQLRHSALTHAAEDGASTPMLLAYSGHQSVTSLAKYTRVSSGSLQHWQEDRDPATRR